MSIASAACLRLRYWEVTIANLKSRSSTGSTLAALPVNRVGPEEVASVLLIAGSHDSTRLTPSFYFCLLWPWRGKVEVTTVVDG
jgi:hypothetical protein